MPRDSRPTCSPPTTAATSPTASTGSPCTSRKGFGGNIARPKSYAIFPSKSRKTRKFGQFVPLHEGYRVRELRPGRGTKRVEGVRGDGLGRRQQRARSRRGRIRVSRGRKGRQFMKDAFRQCLSVARSMKVAIAKAKTSGVGWVTARRSNHFGICQWYTDMALEQGLIGMAATNTSPLVTPTRAKEQGSSTE